MNLELVQKRAERRLLFPPPGHEIGEETVCAPFHGNHGVSGDGAEVRVPFGSYPSLARGESRGGGAGDNERLPAVHAREERRAVELVDGDDVQRDANVVDIAGVREKVGAEGVARLEGVAKLGLDAQGEDEGEDGGDAREADEDAVEAAGWGWGWGASSAVVFVVAVGGVGFEGRRDGGGPHDGGDQGWRAWVVPFECPFPAPSERPPTTTEVGSSSRRGGAEEEVDLPRRMVASASATPRRWRGVARGRVGGRRGTGTTTVPMTLVSVAYIFPGSGHDVIDTPPGERRGRVAQHRPCEAGSDRLLIRPR